MSDSQNTYNDVSGAQIWKGRVIEDMSISAPVFSEVVSPDDPKYKSISYEDKYSIDFLFSPKLLETTKWNDTEAQIYYSNAHVKLFIGIDMEENTVGFWVVGLQNYIGTFSQAFATNIDSFNIDFGHGKQPLVCVEQNYLTSCDLSTYCLANCSLKPIYEIEILSVQITTTINNEDIPLFINDFMGSLRFRNPPAAPMPFCTEVIPPKTAEYDSISSYNKFEMAMNYSPVFLDTVNWSDTETTQYSRDSPVIIYFGFHEETHKLLFWIDGLDNYINILETDFYLNFGHSQINLDISSGYYIASYDIPDKTSFIIPFFEISDATNTLFINSNQITIEIPDLNNVPTNTVSRIPQGYLSCVNLVYDDNFKSFTNWTEAKSKEFIQIAPIKTYFTLDVSQNLVKILVTGIQNYESILKNMTQSQMTSFTINYGYDEKGLHKEMTESTEYTYTCDLTPFKISNAGLDQTLFYYSININAITISVAINGTSENLFTNTAHVSITNTKLIPTLINPPIYSVINAPSTPEYTNAEDVDKHSFDFIFSDAFNVLTSWTPDEQILNYTNAFLKVYMCFLWQNEVKFWVAGLDNYKPTFDSVFLTKPVRNFTIDCGFGPNVLTKEGGYYVSVKDITKGNMESVQDIESICIGVNTDYGNMVVFQSHPMGALRMVSCLLEGTKVKTQNGWVQIEHLKIGDYVLNQHGKSVRIIKTMKSIIKYSDQNDNAAVYKVPAGQLGCIWDLYISKHHKIQKQDGTFAKAYTMSLEKAKKSALCKKADIYILYNIQVENHTENSLIVNGNCVIESWNGKQDLQNKPLLANKLKKTIRFLRSPPII